MASDLSDLGLLVIGKIGPQPFTSDEDDDPRRRRLASDVNGDKPSGSGSVAYGQAIGKRSA